MATQLLQQLETDFFRALNNIAEPLIRAGFGNPLLWPTGTIVIETTGRKSGRKYNVPVLATRFGDLMIFSTVRRNSQWVRNLAVNPQVRYWLAGKPVDATACVFTQASAAESTNELPEQVACLAKWLRLQSQFFGVSFAILIPARTAE